TFLRLFVPFCGQSFYSPLGGIIRHPATPTAMLIRSPKNWELPESAATPETIYHNRRAFLKTLGFGAAATALGAHDLFATTAGFPTKVNPEYRDPALKPTAYEHITSYNNFYEFGLDKAEPRVMANRGWKTEPWTVELAGLCRNPLKLE